MRKTKETMIINGKVFEVTHLTRYSETGSYERVKREIAPLSYYYNKPSIYKQEIYNDWLKWSYGVEGMMLFNVSGGNCNYFSLRGLIDREDGVTLEVYITYAHNRVYVYDL